MFYNEFSRGGRELVAIYWSFQYLVLYPEEGSIAETSVKTLKITALVLPFSILHYAYTSTEGVVIKVGEALNVTIELDDIDISHKINHGKVILAKFVSHKVKSKLYKKRTKLKKVKINDLPI